MTLPKGGRGQKAPYQTCVVRIPTDLQSHVEKLTEEYREAKVNGTEFTNLGSEATQESSQLNYDVVIAEAIKILRGKKLTKKEAVQKILQLVFPEHSEAIKSELINL